MSILACAAADDDADVWTSIVRTCVCVMAIIIIDVAGKDRRLASLFISRPPHFIKSFDFSFLDTLYRWMVFFFSSFLVLSQAKEANFIKKNKV